MTPRPMSNVTAMIRYAVSRGRSIEREYTEEAADALLDECDRAYEYRFADTHYGTTFWGTAPDGQPWQISLVRY